MKRRNFIFTSFATLALLSKLKVKFTTPSTSVKRGITSNTESHITLFNSQTINLPTNPLPIATLVHFKVLTNKWSTGPIILANGLKINGEVKNLIIKNEIDLNKSNQFTLQYMGEDIGWNIIS